MKRAAGPTGTGLSIRFIAMHGTMIVWKHAI